MEENLRKAKTIITEELEGAGYQVERILLFGSRARGAPRPDSDWDFLVVVDREIERPLKMRLSARIRTRLVFEEDMPADILILSAQRFADRKSDVGHIAYYALKEGIAV